MHQYYKVTYSILISVVLLNYCLAILVFLSCLIFQALGMFEMNNHSIATLAGVIVAMIGLLKVIVKTTGKKTLKASS